jgi:hypothetical protein
LFVVSDSALAVNRFRRQYNERAGVDPGHLFRCPVVDCSLSGVITAGRGTLGSYLCFVITKGELSPKAIYNQIVESKKKKTYQEFGFDLEKYERLMR